jgi:hypothetical protein
VWEKKDEPRANADWLTGRPTKVWRKVPRLLDADNADLMLAFPANLSLSAENKEKN